MDGGVVAFILAIVVVAILLFVAILLTGKRNGHRFNVEAYQAKFLAIENKLNKENTATFMNTVISADKLLDRAMTEMGVPGKTMGERLKKMGDKFSDIDAVWRAHKLRNALAHEDDLEISYKQAAGALSIYKQALKDLGAI